MYPIIDSFLVLGVAVCVVQVIVFYGPTGTGKSYRAMQMARRPVYRKESSNLWFNLYKGQKDVVLDDYNGNFPIDMFLRLTDCYGMTVEVKNHHANWAPERIFISSNKHPDLWYPGLTDDQRDAFRRRLTQVIHMTQVYVAPPPLPPSDDQVIPRSPSGSEPSTPPADHPSRMLRQEVAPMSPLGLPYAESHASPGARSNASRAASVAESEGARSRASLATTESPRSNGSGQSPLQARSAESAGTRSGALSAPVTPINSDSRHRRSSHSEHIHRHSSHGDLIHRHSLDAGDYGPVRSYSPLDRDNSSLRREIEASSSRSLSALADYHRISLPQSGIQRIAGATTSARDRLSQSHSVLSSPVAAANASSYSPLAAVSVSSSPRAVNGPALSQGGRIGLGSMSDQWTQPRSVHSSHSTPSSASPLSQNPIFVGPNEALLRTPTSSAVSNRINAYADVTPEMLMGTAELRQFEARLRLVHGTNTSAHLATTHAVRNLQSAFEQSSPRNVHHVNASDWAMPGVTCTSSANTSHLGLHSYGGAGQPIIQNPRPLVASDDVYVPARGTTASLRPLLQSWPPVASSDTPRAYAESGTSSFGTYGATAVDYATSRQPVSVVSPLWQQQQQQQRSLVIEQRPPSVQAARPLLQSWPPQQQQQFASATGNATATQIFDLME